MRNYAGEISPAVRESAHRGTLVQLELAVPALRATHSERGIESGVQNRLVARGCCLNFIVHERDFGRDIDFREQIECGELLGVADESSSVNPFLALASLMPHDLEQSRKIVEYRTLALVDEDEEWLYGHAGKNTLEDQNLIGDVLN